nr:hypothetical protein [Geodermatophilaceae bacterium]
MFEGEFTGDWVFAAGEWHPEIYDPIDLDPAQISHGVDVSLPNCPTGAGLAILLAGHADTAVPEAGVL